MIKKIAITIAALALTGPAFAESHTMSADATAELAPPTGDAAAGEKDFRKCKACHSVVDDDGKSIVKGGKVGPNLYGVVGRQAGSLEDYNYGDSIVAAGEGGLIWNEEHFVGFVEDPKGYLAEVLDDKSARSKMSFKLRKGAADVYAYLASVGPDMSAEMDADKADAAETSN